MAPGQRVPYAYTDLFGFQGAQPFFPGCDFIVAQFGTGPESLVDALCYAYLTHFLMLKRLFNFF